MAFSGGTFSRTFDCTTDRDNGVKILASKFDTELDGMATGLSTCILKDGTQTCTAAIPFAEGLTVPDNKTIILGTNSDITIQYDESTNDSLEIAANVEGAALGIVLKADQGDDNADQHKVNIADGGTLTMASKISGSFVSYLTHTPNSTVASSTTAVAGNLTVGGDLTLGSGAVISEAELEAIDGVTAGTVTASKAVIVDSNKDIASFRNVTLTGELDAGSLDVSGDADIDGTLETDALSINGTAVTATGAELNYSDTGAAVGTVVASKVVTADANKDVASFRNITLTGELDAGSLDVSGDADIDGTLEADAMTLNGTAITATATLDTGISNNNVPKFTSGVADNDFLRVDGTAIEGRSASEVLSDIAAAPAAGSSNIVTTGALNSGSITSGFGAIDNGSSNITTTGVGTFGSLDISGNIDVDGTTNLDEVDIDGAVSISSTTTFADGSELRLGADNDMALFHSSGVNHLRVNSGTFKLRADDMRFTSQDQTERMRLDSSTGHLLINNTSFASNGTLVVQQTADSKGIAIVDSAAANTFFLENDGTINKIRNNASVPLAFETASTERMRLLSDGKLVLGGTAHDYSGNFGLQIDASGSDNANIIFRTASDSETFIVGADQSLDAGVLNVLSNDPMVFKTNDTERMRIASSGLVGINEASPDRQLHVNAGASNVVAKFESTDGTAAIEFTDNGGSAEIGTVNGAVVFFPGGAQKGLISSDGTLLLNQSAIAGIATATDSNSLELGPGYMVLNRDDTATVTQIAFGKNGSIVGGISTTGSATSLVTSSDRRLKSNIQDAASASDKIDALQVRQFDWNVDGSHQDYGLVAQELQPIEPMAVSGSEDGDEMMGVDYSKLVPMLLKEIQELRSRVATLEAS